jgi:hypothetical protein
VTEQVAGVCDVNVTASVDEAVALTVVFPPNHKDVGEKDKALMVCGAPLTTNDAVPVEIESLPTIFNSAKRS